MVLWLVLFLLIIAISFVLALLSMRDFQEMPHESKVEYGLFLVRKTDNLTTEALETIRQSMASEGLIVSIERLIKGAKSALTVFGPKKVLVPLTPTLDLLELEDYTVNLNSKDTFIWEVGVKNEDQLLTPKFVTIFKSLPILHADDQFFWQVVLSAKNGPQPLFQTQIRAAIFSQEPVRRESLVPLLQDLNMDGLVKVPRPFSKEQMVIFYQSRSLSKDSKSPILSPESVMSLLRIV